MLKINKLELYNHWYYTFTHRVSVNKTKPCYYLCVLINGTTIYPIS